MSTKNVLFVILASYNLKIYEHMINMRRMQLKKYNIPYIFVIDGDLPVGKILGDDEVYFPRLTDTEQKARIAQRLPINAPVHYSNMLFKFQDALKYLDIPNKFPNITHILRLNVSTFVNIKLFSKFFSSVEIPMEKALLGNSSDMLWSSIGKCAIGFLSGTAIMMSRDVSDFFCTLDLRKNIYSYSHSDDVAICRILSDIGGYEQQVKFSRFDFNESLKPDCDEYKNYHFIRVKNEENREIIDLAIWSKMLYELDNLYYNLSV